MTIDDKRPVRRLVAGLDEAGRTRILSDGVPPRRVRHDATGHELNDLWTTDRVPPDFTRDDTDPTLAPHRYFPSAGGTRFMINRLQSRREQRRAAAQADTDAANAAYAAATPGLADTMEPDGAGMHTSTTIDYGLILEGAIDVEFDDGVITRLTAGDSYVLKQARHRWHMLEDEGCVIATVLIGV